MRLQLSLTVLILPGFTKSPNIFPLHFPSPLFKAVSAASPFLSLSLPLPLALLDAGGKKQANTGILLMISMSRSIPERAVTATVAGRRSPSGKDKGREG